MNVPHGADERIGQVIADRYRLQRKLGGGSMGDVYEAVHTFTRKHVAIKLLHPDVTTAPNAAGRFLREARAASDIGHPSIVDVLDAGQDSDGSFYLVLTLLEGEDLSHAILRGDLTQNEIVEITIQLLDGLEAAHSRGIVHRDVKPENVFLTRDEKGDLRIKILDFGIAKPLDPSLRLAETQKGVIIGTPFYMSPEQALGDSIDHRSDLWSAGAVLYHMLTRQPPFDAESYTRLAIEIVGTPHVPVTKRLGACPPWLSDVVDRALKKKAGERWQSATQMAGALRSRGEGPKLALDWSEDENRTIRTPSPFGEARDSLEPPPVLSGSRPGKGSWDERSATASPSGSFSVDLTSSVVETSPSMPAALEPQPPRRAEPSSPAIFAPAPPPASRNEPWPAPQTRGAATAVGSHRRSMLIALLVGGTLIALLLGGLLAYLVT